MIGFAITTIVISPIVFLAVGFYGVSKKRAEESRETVPPQPRVATTPSQSTPPLDKASRSSQLMRKRLG